MRLTRLTRSPARKVIVVALAVGLAVLWWGWSLPANADGSDVAQHLGEASTALGRLTGSVGPEGGYGGEPNAGAVPFLGADPTHGIPGVFEQLSGLSQFEGFNADDDQTAQVITDKINAVDGALDHVDLSDPVYCGGTCNKDTKVADVTSIQFRVSATDDRPPGEVSFTSLGLPSMSFLPKGGKLTVDLNWSVNVDVIADANGLRMVPIAGQHALVLDAHITLPTDPFTVNLGALKVEATSTTQPGFHGKLTVDVDNAGAFSYGFDDAGFKADWHLKTKDDSPLTGIETDLDINWLLSGPHVNTSGLNIKLDHIKVDARKLVGEDLADAAGDLRDVIHPIRTATSPLLEPIPGLSDLSNVIQQGDVSMARLAQYAGGEDGSNLRKTLERIVLVDDVLGSLSGGDDTPDLGSITLVGETAVQPAGAINVEGLKSIAEKCEQCKQAMDAILKAANGTELSFDQGFKFDFPVMRNPATLAGLLFGRDVDLVTFDTGKIGLDTHVHIPIASIIIFDIEVDGDIKALVHLKGGLDTRGIKDALSAGGGFADVLNGIYLQHPDSGAVARLESDVGLKAAVGFGLAKIGGGPSLHVVLDVPPSLPDGKLRPALVDDLGCTLLSGPNARADFGVFISAEYDLIFDSHTDILASHTFLTREDLCQPEAKADEVAELVNGRLQIKTGSQRDVPGGQPDMVKVYARHDNQGVPTSIVVSVNNNKHVEKPAKDVTTVAYDSAGDNRPVNFRAVASDGKAFEKPVDIATGDGMDDVMLDTESFARVVVNGGDDKVIATAGGGLIGGGAGNDYLSGGPHVDFLGGGPGNDTLDGLGGSDSLFGGPGDDALLDSSPDHNCLAGEAGSDRLLSGFGGDDLSGDEGSLFSACAASNPNPEEAGDPAGGADRIVTGGGHDRVFGGNGDDDVRLNGGEVPGKPDNPAYAANVIVHGNGGKDRITTGDGADYIHGGPDDDVIHAGQGSNEVYGGLGADTIDAGGSDDLLFGDNGVDKCASPTLGVPVTPSTNGGNDDVTGGGGFDHIALESGDDTADGGAGDDVVCGHAGNDTVVGDLGNDDIFGNDGADDLSGDANDDRLVGGSADATTPDTGTTDDGFGDHVRGGNGIDTIAGDNATVSPSGAVTLLSESTIGQPDVLYGGDGHDAMYGEHGADNLFGGAGDDHAEGGDGADVMYGEVGQDDLIGGTTETADGAADGEGNQPDAGDQLFGGDGHDVLAGDNAAIARFGSFDAWTADDVVDRPGTADDVLGIVRRRVTLFDIPTTTASAAATGFSGDDHLFGDAGHDILYGQAGDDELQGGAQDDYLEGGAGKDAGYGQAGQDDLVGGTGRKISDAPASVSDGRLDGADALFGDDDAALRPLAGADDYDVVVGDNATVLRDDPFFTGTAGSRWGVNSFNSAIHRTLFLYDVDAVGAPSQIGTGAADTLRGQAADDVLYGQAGDDDMEGGDGDDYMEGNAGSDSLRGLNGNDDIVGGTGRINNDPAIGTNGRLESAETLSGGPGYDVIAGDNAIIRRVLSPSGSWLANTFNGGVQHERTQLLDMASVANPNVPGTVFGNDTIDGNEDDDLVYGQGGDDAIRGNDGDDYLEGNAGADVMQGGANQDDMIGGTGRVNQDLPTGGNGRFDANDAMYGADLFAGEGGDGGDDYDVMIGDNGVVERPLTPLPAGDWKVNTFNDGIERSVTMLDLDLASAPAADTRVRGDDTMFGNGDDDLIRGQGGNDTMHGNDGDDDMEGNGGVDRMYGEANQDDMLGGSRVAGRRDAGDFLYGGADHDTIAGDNSLIVRPLTPLPAGDWQVQDYGHVFNDAVGAIDQQRVIRTLTNLDSAIGVTSGSDVIHGEAGDDELFGQLDDTGDNNGGTGPVSVTENCDRRPLNMTDDPFFTGEPIGKFTIAGDLVCGGDGEDAMLGDQGTVRSFVEHGNQTVLTQAGAPFITETSHVEGSLARQVVLEGIPAGGADVLLGDDPTNRVQDGVIAAGLGAHDSIHGGAGPDIINGEQGDDFLFGDDGSDTIWGGDHNDHVWGGYEGDFIDVLPRTNETAGTAADDPIAWFFFAPDDPDTLDNPATPAREGYDGYRGFDIVYGGWGQDAMQANEGDNGPVAGDRLVDWAGAYNVYYLCPSTYGEYVSTRQLSPSMVTYLQRQAEADGATDVAGGPRGADSGFDELALVYQQDIKQNTNPVHPDSPGHFTCS